MEPLAYVVMNENTLGYLYKPNNFFYIGVFKSVAHHSPQDGPYPVSELDTLRKATKEDFESFNVSWEGCL
jgi:hypothetical protein